MKKYTFLLVIGVIFAVFFGLQRHTSAITLDRGYFTGGVIQNYPSWEDVWFGGITALGGSPSKAAFESFVLAKYSGGGKDAVGAAYIISTMLGNASPGFGKSLSAAEIQKWKDALSNPAVTMGTQLVSYTVNTAYINGLNDIGAYSESGTKTALVFRVSGIAKYVIKTDCANPLGDYPGLPDYNPNSPPAGAFSSATCSSDGTTITIKALYADPDGSGGDTRAYVANKAGTRQSPVFGPNRSFTWVTNTSVLPYSEWPVELWLEDVGPGNYVQVDTIAMPNCKPVGNITSATCTLFAGTASDANTSAELGMWFDVYQSDGTTLIQSRGGGTYLTAGHKYSFSPLTGFMKNDFGGWKPIIVKVYAKNVPGGAKTFIDQATVNPCRTTTCTANSFAGGSEVGVPQTFTVTIRATNVNNPATAVNGAGTYGFNPAATDNLSVSVKDPASTVVYNNPDAPYTYAFPNINSNPITYTPMSPGTYTMSYAFPYLSSGAGCGASATASFHPYFSVLGGDVAAGLTNDSGATPCVPLISGPGNTSIVRSWNFDNNPAGNYYGAGGQTGVFALAQISSFISGLNPLAIPTAATAVQTSLVSPVKTSFANTAPLGGVTVTPTTGTFGGGFGSYGYCLDDYVTEAQNRISATSPGGNTFTIVPGVTPSGTYKFAGPVTVTGGLSANQRISVVSGADIVMGSDFTYPLGVGATGAVPYFEALAAGSIYVNHGVHNLFGFYDAQSGAFATCANGTTETTDYDTCNSSLTIDGAVSAKAIHFDRTFGNLHPVAGLPDTGKPAEVIRFSPAFWIGALGECTSDPTLCQSNGYPYDSITSLPPVL